MTRPILNEDELNALLAMGVSVQRQGQRHFWFMARTLFVLCYIAAITLAVILFPDRILAKFNFPAALPPFASYDYLVLRVVTLVAAAALYCFSYWRDWYFSYVALGAVLMALGNLVNDYFTLYIYTRPDALMTVQAIMALRCFNIVLLIINFTSSRKKITTG